MSKSHAREIALHTSKDLNSWDTAIADAEKLIEESKGRITRLKRAIKGFQELRDRGEPFPGESAEQSEAAGQ